MTPRVMTIQRKDLMVQQQQQRLKQEEYRLCARVASLIEEQRDQERFPGSSPLRPRIGIFGARGILREGAWPGYAGDLYTIEAIAEAGGDPLILPCYPILPGMDSFDFLANKDLFRSVFESVWPVVRDVHGIVFTGGGDLDSRFFYQRIPHPYLQPPDLWRDIWEWLSALINWALFKTTFGICRGMQLMNVALGGELFQDQAELQSCKDIVPLLTHRRGRPIFKNLTNHPIHIVPGSWLALAVRGRGEHAGWRYYLDEVLSQHHNFVGVVHPETMKVIGRLADELTVIGYAPDGVIEAVASKDPRHKYWAVQFHPEYAKSLAWSSGIFSMVVEQSAADLSLSPLLFESFKEDIFAWLWLKASALHGYTTGGEKETPEVAALPSSFWPVPDKQPITEDLQKSPELVASLSSSLKEA